MEAPKSLRRPLNWQDFESLCKKLWGEIWNCPEIKKNGRAGQNQNGVDIFGIPEGENDYYAIQCKGKDEYTDKQFTEIELNSEIDKAKRFEPALKKLYFVTTATKDVKIEAIVRKKNIEHKTNGLFEVHLFSWEDIVDLIDENRKTHDWYFKNQKFKTSQNASLTFDDNSLEKEVVVKFKQIVTNFRQRLVPANLQDTIFANPAMILPIYDSPWDPKINHSYHQFYFRLHNLGEDPIENYKIHFEIEGEFQDLMRVRNWSGMIPPKNPIPYDTFILDNKRSGQIIPMKNMLVSEDSVGFDDLGIKPLPNESSVIIKWKLLSKDFKTRGELKLHFKPIIEIAQKTVLVTDPFEVRVVTGEIKEFIEKVK